MNRPSDGADDARVIFEHIPKASGTTFIKIAQRYYDPARTFRISGTSVLESINEFKSLPLEQRSTYHFIYGHRAMALYDFVPAPRKCVTILRNPVDRIVSLYYYIRRTTSHYLHEEVAKGGLSLDDFVSGRLSAELDNYQVSALAALSSNEVRANPTAALSTAKSVLEKRYSIVGLTDRFNDTVVLARRELDWGWDNAYVKKNVTSGRPSVDVISNNVREAILDRNTLDWDLCQYAAERLDISIEKQGMSFLMERPLFKLFNNICSAYRYSKARLSPLVISKND